MVLRLSSLLCCVSRIVSCLQNNHTDMIPFSLGHISALMKNQVDALRGYGIKVHVLCSETSWEEKQEVSTATSPRKPDSTAKTQTHTLMTL